MRYSLGTEKDSRKRERRKKKRKETEKTTGFPIKIDFEKKAPLIPLLIKHHTSGVVSFRRPLSPPSTSMITGRKQRRGERGNE